MKKIKAIIDTDPGIDDANAIVYALLDERFDIKLFTTSNGNVPLRNATRNLCHILDLFEKDIPVVEGYQKRLGNNTEDATFLHTKQGLGGYNPPQKTIRKPIQKDCADAMYEVIKANPNQITLFIFGPHSNVARLFTKYPDAAKLLKNIIMMGGAPVGLKTNPNHNSFNIRTDAPAFQITIDTKVPIVMVPSSIGRDGAYFTEKQVEMLKNTNDIGKFLATMFETYWEPDYKDKRIAGNDITTLYYPIYPRFYHTKKADIKLDAETGKTTPVFHKDGQFKIVMSINREEYISKMFELLKKYNNLHPKFTFLQ